MQEAWEVKKPAPTLYTNEQTLGGLVLSEAPGWAL